MFETAFHPGTRAALAYARALHANPEESPAAAQAAAGDRLCLMRREEAGIVLSARGSALQGLFPADMNAARFHRLWPSADQPLLLAFFDTVLRARSPGVITALGETASGVRLGLEVALFALPDDLAGPGRAIGHLQTLGGEAFLDAEMARLRLLALHPPLARHDPSLRLVFSR